MSSAARRRPGFSRGLLMSLSSETLRQASSLRSNSFWVWGMLGTAIVLATAPGPAHAQRGPCAYLTGSARGVCLKAEARARSEQNRARAEALRPPRSPSNESYSSTPRGTLPGVRPATVRRPAQPTVTELQPYHQQPGEAREAYAARLIRECDAGNDGSCNVYTEQARYNEREKQIWRTRAGLATMHRLCEKYSNYLAHCKAEVVIREHLGIRPPPPTAAQLAKQAEDRAAYQARVAECRSDVEQRRASGEIVLSDACSFSAAIP